VDLAGDEAGTASAADPDLFMTVLEAREQIEAAQSEGELEGLKHENDERMTECVDVLGSALQEGDVETATAECVRLRYWVNIRESIQAWEKGGEVRLQH